MYELSLLTALDREEPTATSVEPRSLLKICAWCGKLMSEGDATDGVSHGVCLSCLSDSLFFPTETLESISDEELDELPFGAIRISPQGVVLAYNEAESRLSANRPGDVIGKNFFDQVAPCTCVSEFRGEFLRLVQAERDGRTDLKFIFRFASGAVLVSVILLYEAQSKQGMILVTPLVQESASQSGRLG